MSAHVFQNEIAQHLDEGMDAFVGKPISPEGLAEAEDAMVRRVVDLEKPAHTDYRALYRFPGVIVGDYSTVGWDTLLWPLPGVAMAIH